MNSQFPFPTGECLKGLLNFDRYVDLDDLFAHTLIQPLSILFDAPKKNIRGDLVELGFSLCGYRNSVGLNACCKLLEMLHVASLIVDDIEDESVERRGKPALHEVYGVPVALNAGNWLYFLPLNLIHEIPVSEECRMALMKECSKILLLAHYGQALDVGIQIRDLPQKRIVEVAMSSIELKTGVLTGFALSIGAILNKSDSIQKIIRLGRRLGIALQMFDDIGNSSSRSNPQKRAEDLRLGRLTFVAAVAARTLSDKLYKDFENLGVLENPDFAHQWLLENGVLTAAKNEATFYLDQTISDLKRTFSINEQQIFELSQLRQKLMGSYDSI